MKLTNGLNMKSSQENLGVCVGCKDSLPKKELTIINKKLVCAYCEMCVEISKDRKSK
jgi:hypothetical protein